MKPASRRGFLRSVGEACPPICPPVAPIRFSFSTPGLAPAPRLRRRRHHLPGPGLRRTHAPRRDRQTPRRHRSCAVQRRTSSCPRPPTTRRASASSRAVVPPLRLSSLRRDPPFRPLGLPANTNPGRIVPRRWSVNSVSSIVQVFWCKKAV